MDQNVGYGDVVARLGRVEAKIDMLLAVAYGGSPASWGDRGRDKDASGVFEGLTVKQHAVLQMLINGKSNAEIAERLGISENTAKVHVRLLARKAGGHKRQQIVAFFKRALDDVDEEHYKMLTRGLPKDWDVGWGNGSEQHDALLRGE